MPGDRLLKLTERQLLHAAAGLNVLATYFESGNEVWDGLSTGDGRVERILAPDLERLADQLRAGACDVAVPSFQAWIVMGYERNVPGGADTLTMMNVVAASASDAIDLAWSGEFQRPANEVPGVPTQRENWLAMRPDDMRPGRPPRQQESP